MFMLVILWMLHCYDLTDKDDTESSQVLGNFRLTC